jgi:folate-dependent phosphoribosylglycinamide formyltransferase PurN
VIVQEELRTEPRETLEERIHAVEHRLLPATVRDLLQPSSNNLLQARSGAR